jgi:hypothetical protein
MCEISSIPYFKEIAVFIFMILFVVSIIRDGKCSCKKEIEELKDEIRSLKE